MKAFMMILGNGTQGNRWGDYSTSIFDSSSGWFWAFADWNSSQNPSKQENNIVSIAP
jgi:hypothetical protein